MKVVVIIERGADGTYGAYIANDNMPFGAIGDGNTVAEAIEDFNNSIEEMRELYLEEGKEFPNLEFEYRYDTASFLQMYAYAFTLAGLERITGIHQKQLSHYINGLKKPRKRTIEQIEERLHTFANEISAIRFI